MPKINKHGRKLNNLYKASKDSIKTPNGYVNEIVYDAANDYVYSKIVSENTWTEFIDWWNIYVHRCTVHLTAQQISDVIDFMVTIRSRYSAEEWQTYMGGR